MGFPKKISQLPLNLSVKPEDLLVTVNGNNVTSKIKLEQLTNFLTGSTNSFVTGGTYNNITQSIDFLGNSGFPPFSVNLSQIVDSDTFVTGATLNGLVLEIDRNNGEPQITVDLSSLTGDTDTNTFVTGTTLVGDNYTINQNNGTSFTTDFNPIVSGKVDTTLFDSYTADTQTEINSKLNITTFDNYTANTVDNNTFITGTTLVGTNYTINENNGSSFTTDFNSIVSGKVDTILFDTYTANTKTDIDSKLDITTFDDYTANTKDNVVTGATLNGNLLELERNNGLSGVTVDLSSLSASTPTIDEVIAAGNQLTNTNSTLDLPLGGNIDWSTFGGQQNFYITNSSAASTYIRIVNKGGELEMDDSMISLASFAGKDLELKTGGNTDDFRIYLGTTGPSIGDVLEVKSLDGNTGIMGWATPNDVFVTSGEADAATQQLTFTNNSGGTFSVTNAAALFTDNDINVTGGTYDNNTGCVTFFTNSGSSFPICGFVTGLTDTYTSSGTYDNNTAEITFTRTDASTYTVDLSTLDLNDTFSTGGTVTQSSSIGSSEVTVQIVGNEGFSPYNITGLTDTFINDFSISSNTFTISQNDGSSFVATADTIDLASVLSAVTFDIGTSGSISATTFNGGTFNGTFVGDGSGLTGITDNDTFVTGGTVSTSANTLTLNYNNGSTVTPISGINDLPICRIAITGNTGLSNTNNGVDFLALYNGEVYNTDPTEFIRQNSKIQIVNSGRYMIRARYSSYDMVGNTNFLRLAAISASTSNNADLGTKLEYLDQGFIGTTGSGEASKMGSTIYNASGGEWIGVVVLHGGATGGSGAQGYPVYDNTLFNQPYLEIIKIGT